MSASAETGLFLDGLRCAGCVNRTERALRAAVGVSDATVNYTNHRALVHFNPEQTSPAELAEQVADLGFHATPFDPSSLERPDPRGSREALVRLLVAGFLAMNVMWIAIALYTGSYQGMDTETRWLLRWVAIALSVPAVTWCALPFWKGALGGLLRRELTIDVPIVLGVAVSFGVSILGTLAESDHLYMDSAAVIVFLILLGRTLERGARHKATQAVDRLTELTPKLALRRCANGLESIPAQDLRPGDRVVVPVGEVIAADAIILHGATETDESPFTGESEPIHRKVGDPVTGGTRNLLAEIEIEITAAVDAGTLSQLAGLLERAQAERPHMQQLADRIASVFAPAVLCIAAATALYWAIMGAPAMDVALTTAAVLIVACPCALGLATPAAVTAAVGRAAQLGILIKRGDALERCAHVDAVLLDKTGTLTEGRLQVERVESALGISTQQVLSAAANAEGQATHPIAVAIREAAAQDAGVETEELERENLAGLGVVARRKDFRLCVGNRALLEQLDISIPSPHATLGESLASQGLSIAWVARNDLVLGVLGLFDAPREDARDAVEQLSDAGLAVSLVTGDHLEAGRRAARSSGISDVSTSITPAGKLSRVTQLQQAGSRVLVAGDGINDAAALGAADVGVAMARGSDVTLHASDVVILASRLGALPDLIALSKSCLARIRENLGFALLYNAVAVPLAIGGWLEPLHAAIAMSLSSVAVTANAIRLLRWKSAS